MIGSDQTTTPAAAQRQFIRIAAQLVQVRLQLEQLAQGLERDDFGRMGGTDGPGDPEDQLPVSLEFHLHGSAEHVALKLQTTIEDLLSSSCVCGNDFDLEWLSRHALPGVADKSIKEMLEHRLEPGPSLRDEIPDGYHLGSDALAAVLVEQAVIGSAG